MRDDDLQARIDAIERVLYHPQNYAVNVISPPAPADQQTVTELAAELNSLRAEQIRRAAEKFGPLAPIGGARLSTGELPRPDPPVPDSWMSEGRTYDPLRRFIEVDLHQEWDDS